MKKTILISIAVVCAILTASCDSKTCKCYLYNGVNTPYMEYEYVSEGTPCTSLDYDRTGQYRKCIEYNEPDIDPTEIGQEYKGK